MIFLFYFLSKRQYFPRKARPWIFLRSAVGAVPSPNTGVVVADEPVRRKEDEEGGEDAENVNGSDDRDLAAAYDPEDFETGVNEEEEEEESNEKDKKSKPSEVLRSYQDLRSETLNKVPKETVDRVTEAHNKTISTERKNTEETAKKTANEKIKKEKEQVTKDRATLNGWIKPDTESSVKELTKLGIETRLKEEVSGKETLKKDIEAKVIQMQDNVKSSLAEARSSLGQSLERMDGENQSIGDILNKSNSGYPLLDTDPYLFQGRDSRTVTELYTQAYKDIAQNIDIGLETSLKYDSLTKKEIETYEKQLKAQGLNPPEANYGLSKDPILAGELRKSYEKLIVNMAFQERVTSELTKQSTNLGIEIKDKTTQIINEVTILVNSIDKREKDAYYANISYTDESGKIVTKMVDVRDSNLTAKEKKLAEKVIKVKEETKVNQDLAKTLKEFDATQDKLLQNKIFDEAVKLELKQLQKLSGYELRAIGLDNVGASEAELNKIKDKKLKEKKALNADRIKELNSLQLENRAKQISNMLQMNQNGKIDSGVAKQLLGTYELFQKMDIEKVLEGVPESKKGTVRESLELIKSMGSNSDFALQTASALCNVISGWEAAMLAGRNVEPDFTKFYVKQVLNGEITVGDHGKNKAVFYGSGKDYLGKSHVIEKVIDMDKNDVLAELNKGPNKVAIVQIDTDKIPDGKGNHFIIAYQNTNGEWIMQDHTSNDSWRNGGKLVDALKENKITSIRILD
ncbi:hypothetical protein P3G55_13115 [Leptospira sp. 96542]|nr:hypothetical protein [Leptospira sp. 96542]